MAYSAWTFVKPVSNSGRKLIKILIFVGLPRRMTAQVPATVHRRQDEAQRNRLELKGWLMVNQIM